MIITQALGCSDEGHTYAMNLKQQQQQQHTPQQLP
jgi:hypothetical protein